MLKPLLLRRPSGLYVRFRVPSDLRWAVGSRFLVRPLHREGNAALLVAAHMGLALSGLFAAIRRGSVKDPKEALGHALEDPSRRDLTLRDVVLPDGSKVASVDIKTPEDARLWKLLNDDGTGLEHIGRLDAFALPRQPPPPLTPLLSKVIQDHLKDMKNASRQVGTILDRRNTLTLFLDLVGDEAIGDVTHSHVRVFLDALHSWPVNARKLRAYRGMAPSAIVAKVRAHPHGVITLSDRSRDKHRDQLAHFFNLQIEQRVISVSPLVGVPRHDASKATRRQHRRPFEPQELARIFDLGPWLPWASKWPHRWWGPLLGTATGARLAEVAQLYADDICQVAGTWGISLTNERPDQRLKDGDNDQRFIPLHDGLLAAGFLDYVQDARSAGHKRLFPNLPYHSKAGYGDQLGDQFRAYVKKLGITEAGRGFHTYRHSATTTMVHSGKSAVTTTSAITGHALKLPGSMGTYVAPAGLPAMVDAVNELYFPPGIPPYETGQSQAAFDQLGAQVKKWGKNAARAREKASAP